MTDLDHSVEVVAAPHLGSDAYLDRELAWLDFNERVLALAEDDSRPLLERAKFLAIVGQNLDEFFQIRVAGLKAQVAAGVSISGPDALGPSAQLAAIRERVLQHVSRQARVFTYDLAPGLEKEGIRIGGWDEMADEDRAWLRRFFDVELFPVLTPLAVDRAHPFPYISNLSLNLAVVVSDAASAPPRFARVKVPLSLPRFVALPDGERFVRLEELVSACLDALFPGMEILARYPFRVTRNADLALEEDEADDLLSAMESGLLQRRRSPHAVRLEIGAGMMPSVLDLLVDELEIDANDVYATDGLLDLGGLWGLYELDRPDLKDESWSPTTQPRLAGIKRSARRTDPLVPGTPAVAAQAAPPGSSIFDVLREGDILLHHPYDSFKTSVEAFIEHAASDPDVLAIKWTLYRTSGPPSPIIRNLIRAAEAGKQVVALVELKARFDEEANIAWARALEEAGVHVVYGLVGFKTHAKIALVVRRERDRITRYTHVGTGNYNPNTATVYEDIGVLSADPGVGADLSDLFNLLTGYSRQARFRKLLVAPHALRPSLLDLIARESTPNGRIVMKLNNLVDHQIIDGIYAASQRGARIDLIVRGICSLRPGVPGLSEGIRVRSIVGRFLEHSRIFRFGGDDLDSDDYIGSADLMTRNLDGRIEALLPVTDPLLKARLHEILEVNLADDMLAWSLRPDGTWAPPEREGGVDTHQRLRELALARSRSDRNDN